MAVNFIKKYSSVIKGAVQAFSHDNCVKLSAALSYYTIFSISPLLIIVISLSSIFFGKEAIQGKIYGQLHKLLGDTAALQIQDIIAASTHRGQGKIGTIIGIVVLVIGATGIFTEIQDSINFIWSLKAKPKRGIVKYFTNRALSFSLIVSLGFLLMVSLVLSALIGCVKRSSYGVFSTHNSLPILRHKLGNYFYDYCIAIYHYLQSTTRWKNQMGRCIYGCRIHCYSFHFGQRHHQLLPWQI